MSTDNVLSERRKEILKAIVDDYIEKNVAVSSLNIQKSMIKSISSATIRNEMLLLEKHGFLKKEHQSSGRIPTKLGYKTYINNLMKTIKIENIEIKEKLIELFSQRHESIDSTIDKSVTLISKFLNLPIIVTQTKNASKELLKKIDVTQINENTFVVFIVTSSGEIYKNTLNVENFNEINDLNICVRLMNDKIIDCPINLIEEKIKEIIPELRKNVHKFEFVYVSIISKIIEKIIQNTKQKTKVYNQNSIIYQPEIQNKEIEISKIFELLENFSSFQQIEFNYLKTGNTLINLENKVKGVSLATTVLDLKEKKHQLTIVGPNRMNYPLIKYFLEFINEKLIAKKD